MHRRANREAAYYRRLLLACAVLTLALLVVVFYPWLSSFARPSASTAPFGIWLPLVLGANNPPAPRVLLFSKTSGFRHASIPAALDAIRTLGAEHGFAVDASEDASAFTDANLAQYRAVVFVMTTGDVLDETQQAAFERYIRAGNGYVGLHSASDTEYSWPWYGQLVGAYFASHPAIQAATIRVEDRAHPSTTALPDPWPRTDEWYNFQSNPRSRVRVLARLDETSYTGGTMGADHPIAWCQAYDGGRAWYTGGGHTSESYAEPLFLQHILGGIEYAAGLKAGDCRAAGDG